MSYRRIDGKVHRWRIGRKRPSPRWTPSLDLVDIAITGSSGLIGTALRESLVRHGHRVLRVVRSAPHGSDEIAWDPMAGTIDAAGLEGLDGVVNLAGAGIADKRWTDDRKRELVESRTRGTALLARTLAGLERKPRVLVSGSAVGYYGSRGDEKLTETSPPGDDFLAQLCVDWEAATAPASDAGIRVAVIRTGVVLSAKGGPLGKTLSLFKLGLGGKIGSGREWFSWISIDDEVGAIEFLLDPGCSLGGPVNLGGPEPVTNSEYTKAVGHALHRPTVIPVPKLAPRLLLGGELADALLGPSQRMLPAALESAGYVFQHRTVDEAVRAVLDR